MVWGAIASFAAPYLSSGWGSVASGAGSAWGGVSSGAGSAWNWAGSLYGKGGGGGGGGGGGYLSKFWSDFTGQDIKKQQLFNLQKLLGGYETAKQGLLDIPAPDIGAYSTFAGNYMNALRGAIGESGVRDAFGPTYVQALQDLALRQGDVGALAAARAASMSGGGRGASAFGGGASEQVRRAQGEASLGTEANLLQAKTKAEEDRAGISQSIMQVLAGGQQNALQAQLTGLGNIASFRNALLASLGGLGSSLLSGIAGVSPGDTNKTFENTYKIAQQFMDFFKGSGGGGSKGGGVP